MNRFLPVCVAASLAVAGCATVVPQQDVPRDEHGPTLESITKRIQCELTHTLYASSRNYDVLMSNDVDVALQLSLTVNDAGSLAPTLTYLSPPAFSFNAGALLSQAREQNHFEKLYFSMRELAKEVGDRKSQGLQPQIACPAGDTNLAGDLGIQQTFELAMTSLDRLQWKDVKLSPTDGSFGGYAQFVVTKNLNMVGPTWTLKHFKGPGSLAGVSEVNTDKITFAFARGSAAGKPFSVFGNAKNPLTEQLLTQININQLTTQLSNLRIVLQPGL